MRVLIGNIFDSNAQTLVNTVNCVGVMGKGVALEFKKRYPEMFKEYQALCSQNLVAPGKPYLYHDLTSASIINFPTKDNWRSPSKLSYVVSGLDWFVENYESLGITSIAFPPLGCGNGGLSWDIVGPVMYQKLNPLPIDIEIYAPFGTAPDKLTVSFLNRSIADLSNDIIGANSGKMRKSWNLLLYIVRELSKNKYSLMVGRTIFQKICFIATRNGIDTGFSFVRGSYGPYSSQTKEAITILSNANLIYEQTIGNMMKMTVSDSFVFDRSSFSEQELNAAEKTIDLFSRIKNTDQAEMMSTVVFSYDQLHKESNEVSDMDVYKYVVSWKPHWEPQKKDSVCETIQSMAMLGLITIKHDEDFDFADF